MKYYSFIWFLVATLSTLPSVHASVNDNAEEHPLKSTPLFSEIEEFTAPTPSNFQEAIAMTMALLNSEAEYYSTELSQKTISFEETMIFTGFLITAQGLSKTIDTIVSKTSRADHRKAREIIEAFLRKDKINEKAQIALKHFNLKDTEKTTTLSQFIVDKLLSPCAKSPIQPASSKISNPEEWLPDHLKASFRQKKSPAPRKGRQNKKTSQKKKPQTLVKKKIPQAGPVSEIKELDSATAITIESEKPSKAIFEPQDNEKVDQAEIAKTETLELIPSEKVDFATNVEDLKEEDYPQEVAPMVLVKPKTPQKLPVSKESWDVMVKLRKLQDLQLYKGDFNKKIKVKHLFKLIKDVGGIVAPGGKTNINLAVHSLKPSHEKEWYSIGIHRLHGDKAHFLPTDTVSWGNRVKRLLEDANIGPETITVK